MITTLKLVNYRNISSLFLEIDPKINLIVQKNGFGKTNILESIYYAVFRTSFRPLHNYSELIKHSEFEAKIHLGFGIEELEVYITNKSSHLNSFKLLQKRISKKEVQKKMPILLFAPHSVDLVSGEPVLRRKDLDDVISLYDFKYPDSIARYNKVLKNRNAILKTSQDRKSNIRELQFWTDQLIELSEKIHVARIQFFSLVDEFIRSTSEQMYHTLGSLQMRYIPNQEITPSNIKEVYRSKFEQNLQKEIIVGRTLYGPHKDDYKFLADQMDLKFSGSRGQQRIASFIFKVAQHNLIKDKSGSDSILLIDDIFSELDSKHRENIAQFIINSGYQVIITGANIEEFPKDLVNNFKRLF